MRRFFMAYFISSALLLAVCAKNSDAIGIFSHDCTSTYAGGPYTYTDTSVWGIINSPNTVPGFTSQSGTYGLPLGITNVFQVIGLSGQGNTITFDFSPGHDWGSGEELILGNIHNYYGSTISVWDSSNVPIDVKLSTFLAEYDSNTPDISGYFSTGETLLTPVEYSTLFSVVDLLSDTDLGQGCVVHLGGLFDVGRIELMFATSSLGTNSQLADFMLFNVGTVTEPSAGILVVTTFLGFLAFCCEFCGSYRQKISCRSKVYVSCA